MLTNPTLEHLKDMKLSGMVDAYTRQLELPDATGLTFEERFSLIVDYEWTKRKSNQLDRLIRGANFPQEALLEDIIYTEKRKLNKNLIQTLSTTDWIKQGLNVILTGPTGVGKTYLAVSFGYMSCRRNQQVKYYRVNKLLEELATAKADGAYLKFLKQLQKCDLLILDDWGLNSFSTSESRTLLDVVDDRNLKKSTIIVSQIPIDTWGKVIGDSTIADAIMDRIIHNAYILNPDGPSFRSMDAQKRKDAAKPV